MGIHPILAGIQSAKTVENIGIGFAMVYPKQDKSKPITKSEAINLWESGEIGPTSARNAGEWAIKPAQVQILPLPTNPKEDHMNCPTKDQIYKAASRSKEAKQIMSDLFPDLFGRKVQKGEIYEWGTPDNGGSGLVIDNGSYFLFVNFRTGEVYLDFPKGDTNLDLKARLDQLNKLNPKRLHHCYDGNLRGPDRLKSWTTKRCG